MKETLLNSLASALGVFSPAAAYGQSHHGRRPLSRHYRNPKDPAQARRIGKAQGKRNRKGWKLVDDMFKSARNNKAHAHHVPGTMRPDALNPFYIAY